MTDSSNDEELYFDDWLFYRTRRNNRHFSKYTEQSSTRQEER